MLKICQIFGYFENSLQLCIKVYDMKKALMLFTIIALCSCTTKIGDNVEIDIVEAEYDGHSYLIFGGHGVIHNPKFPCHEGHCNSID